MFAGDKEAAGAAAGADGGNEAVTWVMHVSQSYCSNVSYTRSTHIIHKTLLEIKKILIQK